MADPGWAGGILKNSVYGEVLRIREANSRLVTDKFRYMQIMVSNASDGDRQAALKNLVAVVGEQAKLFAAFSNIVTMSTARLLGMADRNLQAYVNAGKGYLAALIDNLDSQLTCLSDKSVSLNDKVRPFMALAREEKSIYNSFARDMGDLENKTDIRALYNAGRDAKTRSLLHVASYACYAIMACCLLALLAGTVSGDENHRLVSDLRLILLESPALPMALMYQVLFSLKNVKINPRCF